MQRSTELDFSGTFWESNVDKKQSARLWGPPESAILSCHVSLKNSNPQHHHPFWDISDVSQEFQKPHHPVSGPQGEKKWGPLACRRRGVAVMLVGRLGVLGWGFSPATGDDRAGNVATGEREGLGISSIPGFDPLDARGTPPPGGHSRDLQMLPGPGRAEVVSPSLPGGWQGGHSPDRGKNWAYSQCHLFRSRFLLDSECMCLWAFPDGPVAKTPTLPMQGVPGSYPHLGN